MTTHDSVWSFLGFASDEIMTKGKVSFKFKHLLILIITMLWAAHSVMYAQIQNIYVNSYNNIVQLNYKKTDPTVSYTNINKGFEAIAHAEDKDGNILFFVNSNGVYDAKGALMKGSTDIYANGSLTEIDICPFPNSTSKYYVFYTMELCSNLYYSVVDMKLNDGLGDVTRLNTLLDTAQMAEGLELIKRPCRNSYWLIAYECGIGFKKYLIDDSGVSNGISIFNYSGPELFLGRGELDYHNGKMGMAFSNNPEPTVFLCNLNPFTGDITNPKTIVLPEGGGNGVYGLEFSPDASKAYFTIWYKPTNNNLFQYDFETEKISTYSIKSTSIDASKAASGPGQIEMGRDGKLYIPFDGGNQLTVINNSNSTNPVFSKLTTNSTLALGMSDHIQSDIVNTKNNFTYKNVCIGETTEFQLESYSCSSQKPQLLWDFGDAESNKKNMSTGTNPTHKYKKAGEYKVTLYINDSLGADTVSHTIVIAAYPKFDLGGDVSLCDGDTITLKANVSNLNYEWSNGGYQQQTKASKGGKYVLKVWDKGCFATDSIMVKLQQKPKAELGNDLWLCDVAVKTLNAGAEATSYKWSTGESAPEINASTSGIYWVTVANDKCLNSDTIELVFQNSPKVNLGKDKLICANETETLDAGKDGSNYLWSTGATTNSIQVNTAGAYSVSVNKGTCTTFDTVLISIREGNSIIIVPDSFVVSAKAPIVEFKVFVKNVNHYQLKLTNAQGKIMYETSDYTKEWNGKMPDATIIPKGVYNYSIEYNSICKPKIEIKKGNLLVK
jgi:PKD repeat protein